MKLATKSQRPVRISKELWEDIELGNRLWDAFIAARVAEMVEGVDRRMMGDNDDRD